MAAGENILPYPIYGASYVFVLPIFDNTGALVTGAAGLDTRISKDLAGDAAATNEATEIATNSGMYYIKLTGTEMTCDLMSGVTDTSTPDAKATPWTLYPRRLPVIRSNTAQAGAEGTITLDAGASADDDYYNGLYVLTDDGDCRLITDYVGSTKVATVGPNFANTPDGSTVFQILVSENCIVNAWAGAAVVDTNIAGIPAVDVIAISGDQTAADNLESQYDTTGLTGDTFPSTQSQLGQISLTGAAVNTPAIDAPDGFTITWGENEANDEDSTHAADGVYHDIEAQDDGGTEKIDVYYEFDIGGDGVPTSVTWQGYLNKGGGAAKNIMPQAYNWGGTSWDQIGSINSGISNSTETFVLFTSHVGTGANLGKVRIRFVTGSVPFSATTLLKTDQIFLSYAIVTRSVGYADGAIWVNTNGSNTNTESYVDGTADNPVSTWAAALTISGNLNITRFRIVNGSTITLSGNSDNYTLIGSEWTLDVNGQSCADAYFQGAHVMGICTGTEIIFRDCDLGRGGSLSCAGMEAHQCALSNGIVLTAGNTYVFDRCHSNSDIVPSLDLEDAAENKVVVLTDYHGDLELENFGHASGTHKVIITGQGHLTLNANCDAAIAADVLDVHGFFDITDNVSGGWGGTIQQEARYDTSEIEKYGGALWHLSATTGNDDNDGGAPNRAFATFGKAISEVSAGDKIIVSAGTYTESSIDVNVPSVWIQGEPGVILTGAGNSVCLTLSGADCRADNISATPGSVRTGFEMTNTRSQFHNCDSIGGAKGFKVNGAATYNKVFNCRAIDYTTIGYEINTATNTFVNCIAETSNSATTGFGTVGDGNLYIGCVSNNNTSSSWNFAAAAMYNQMILCSASETCGIVVDAGVHNTNNLFSDGSALEVDLIDAPNPTALAAISTDVVTAMFAKTDITAGGTASYEDLMKAIYAMARGNIVKTGDTYEYRDDDDTTVLYTLTITAGARSTA